MTARPLPGNRYAYKGTPFVRLYSYKGVFKRTIGSSARNRPRRVSPRRRDMSGGAAAALRAAAAEAEAEQDARRQHVRAVSGGARAPLAERRDSRCGH